MTKSIQVRIKPDPSWPYSFHDEIAGNVYPATTNKDGVYLVEVGALSTDDDKTVWAFADYEVEEV